MLLMAALGLNLLGHALNRFRGLGPERFMLKISLDLALFYFGVCTSCSRSLTDAKHLYVPYNMLVPPGSSAKGGHQQLHVPNHP